VSNNNDNIKKLMDLLGNDSAKATRAMELVSFLEFIYEHGCCIAGWVDVTVPEELKAMLGVEGEPARTLAPMEATDIPKVVEDYLKQTEEKGAPDGSSLH